MEGTTVHTLTAALAMAALLWLGACGDTGPAVDDGGVKPDSLTFPGRCAALSCTEDGICQEDAPTGTARIGGIWGSGPSDIYVVGADGMLLHFDGAAWTSISAKTTSTLHDVWGSGPGDVYVVGSEGTVLHYDGAAWAAMSAGTRGSLRSVWGSGPTQIFVVGQETARSVGLRFDGQKWSTVAALARDRVTLMDVTGDGPKRAAAVGYYYDANKYNLAYQVACKFDGAAWTCSDPGDAGELFGVWLIPGGGNYLVGTCCQDKLHCGGLIQTTGSTSCTPGTLERSVQYHAVWGRDAADIWIAGAGGHLVHHSGDTGKWPRLTTGTTALLRAIWGGKGDVLVGGAYGTLLRHCRP